MEQAEAVYEERPRGDLRQDELKPRNSDDIIRHPAPLNEHRAHVVARLAAEFSKTLALKSAGVAEAAELTEQVTFEESHAVTRYQSGVVNVIATAGQRGFRRAACLRMALGEELPIAPDLKVADVSGLLGVPIKAKYTKCKVLVGEAIN